MMARRAYRRTRSHRIVFGVAIALVVLLVAAPILAHLAVVLVLLTAAGAGCYRLGLARRPVAKATITTADPETAMLRQQAARLQHDLDQARADARQLLTDCNTDVARLRKELDEAAARADQYRAELSRVRAQIDDLEDAAARPIEAITATYRHVQRQYGPAATRRRP